MFGRHLEKPVCECCAVVRREFDRLLTYEIDGLPTTTTKPWRGIFGVG